MQTKAWVMVTILGAVYGWFQESTLVGPDPTIGGTPDILRDDERRYNGSVPLLSGEERAAPGCIQIATNFRPLLVMATAILQSITKLDRYAAPVRNVYRG